MLPEVQLYLRESFDYLYGEWLPESREEVRDFPPFLHRVSLFPDVKEAWLVKEVVVRGSRQLVVGGTPNMLSQTLKVFLEVLLDTNTI